MQLDLLDAFTQFSDLGFFRIVEKRVLRSRIVHVDLAVKRTLSVVEMAALGLDSPARLPGIFFLPLCYDVIVGLDFEQAPEDEWKALSGWLFKRQDFDVVIVHTQMPTMAFDGGFGQVVVEKGVVFEFGKFELVGMKVESLLENAEDFLFV